MGKNEVIRNTRNAFEFIENLYLETTFLIKEIEGLLLQEPEEFIIGKPRGYQVTSIGSSGIDQRNVPNWMTKKMGVFFVPKSMAKEGTRSQTVTFFKKGLKVIYMRILLNGKEIDEPVIWAGALWGFVIKVENKQSKFEEIMTYPEYYENLFFAGFPNIDFEDANLKLRGKLFSNNLFDINTSQEILDKIITPTLKIFREIN